MPFIADNSPAPKLEKMLVRKHKKVPQPYVVVIAPIEFSLTRAYPSAAYAAFNSLLIIISTFDWNDADTHRHTNFRPSRCLGGLRPDPEILILSCCLYKN